MEIERLIELLSDVDAYPHPVQEVELHQTHISAVFLAGPFAYKLKKPVDFGFVDFSTLERRHHYCNEEIRLNRRLAPDVYLGVVPVSRAGGRLEVEGTGEVVEWAVKMDRLDDGDRLSQRLKTGELRLDELARRLAEFHRKADRGPRIAEAARFAAVERNAVENFDQSEPLVGRTVSRTVFDRLRILTRNELDRLRPIIEGRADRGVPCDGHGDIRLDHVYLRPDRSPPDDVIIIDCIEFNEAFRFLDPIADAAFLVMDLMASGDRDAAEQFAAAYLDASGDAEAAGLLPFYVAYRAAVRGKVEGMAASEAELDEEDRADALAEARGHWLLVLGTLEEPARRPGLVLIGGLPGVGKSTLARRIAEQHGFEVIRSDVVRKELAGLSAEEPASSGFGKGIYASEWTERTYAECLRRADTLLFEGRRVIIDASFGREEHRRSFLGLARSRCVPGVILLAHAPAESALGRLTNRSGDASDAGPAIYHAASARWEAASGPDVIPIDTGSDPDITMHQARSALDRIGLRGGGS